MPREQRFSTQESIRCFECLATETVHGKPMVFIGPHLPVHSMTYAAYLRKYPNAPTHSASYRRERQTVSRAAKNRDHIQEMQQSVSDLWMDVTLDFLEDGLLTAQGVELFADIQKQTIIMAVSRKLIEPDGLATLVNQKTGQTRRSFYLFSEETIAQYRKRMRKSPIKD